jgi:hypothetical protein
VRSRPSPAGRRARAPRAAGRRRRRVVEALASELVNPWSMLAMLSTRVDRRISPPCAADEARQRLPERDWSRSAAGSSRSVAARPPPRLSRSVLTKICADACCRRGVQRGQAQSAPTGAGAGCRAGDGHRAACRHRAVVAEAVVRVLQETHEAHGADFLGQTAAARARANLPPGATVPAGAAAASGRDAAGWPGSAVRAAGASAAARGRRRPPASGAAFRDRRRSGCAGRCRAGGRAGRRCAPARRAVWRPRRR